MYFRWQVVSATSIQPKQRWWKNVMRKRAYQPRLQKPLPMSAWSHTIHIPNMDFNLRPSKSFPNWSFTRSSEAYLCHSGTFSIFVYPMILHLHPRMAKSIVSTCGIWIKWKRRFWMENGSPTVLLVSEREEGGGRKKWLGLKCATHSGHWFHDPAWYHHSRQWTQLYRHQHTPSSKTRVSQSTKDLLLAWKRSVIRILLFYAEDSILRHLYYPSSTTFSCVWESRIKYFCVYLLQ